MGSRSHDDPLGFEQFSDHSGVVCLGNGEEPRFYPRFDDPLQDGPGHSGGAAPHRLVHHQRPGLRLPAGPAHVLLHDLGRVFPPDDTMAGGDDVDLQAHLPHLLDLPQNQPTERGQDVGEVPARLLPEDCLVYFVSEAPG